MNEPNKQEREQLASIVRQLERLQSTTDNLYRRMAINGRAEKYPAASREASVLIGQAAGRIRSADDGL